MNGLSSEKTFETDVTQRYTVQNWTRNVFPKPFGAWGTTPMVSAPSSILTLRDNTHGLSTFEYFDLTASRKYSRRLGHPGSEPTSNASSALFVWSVSIT